MAKNRKETYKIANEDSLQEKSQDADVHEITKGILYKVIKSGNGKAANANSVVSV